MVVVVEAWGDLTLLCAGGSLLLYDHRTSKSKFVDVFKEANDVSGTNDGTTKAADEKIPETAKKSGRDEKINRNDDNKTAEDCGSGTEDGKEGDGTEPNGNGTGNRKTEAEKGGTDGNLRRDDDAKTAEDCGSGTGRSGTDGTERVEGRARDKVDGGNMEDDGGSIVAAKFSDDGRWMVVGCGWKAVEVWSVAEGKRMSSYRLVKKPTALAMLGGCVWVSDKSGDVYKFPLPSSSSSSSSSREEPEPILGHLSMLLDLAITPDGNYVITCDRDEKIRVSHLSRPYEIHTFCLGHREFVTKVEALSSQPPRLLSASGDGFIKLWNYENGKCLSQLDISSFVSPYLLPSEAGEERGGGEERGENCSTPPPPNTSPNPPAVPAVKDFAVVSTSAVHLVAAIVCRARAIVVCQVDETDTLLHLSTIPLPEVALSLTWRGGAKVVVVVEGGGVVVVEGGGGEWRQVEEVEDTSGLVRLGKLHSAWLKGNSRGGSLSHLYKQRFDNVTRYLEKKTERLRVEEAFHMGTGPPPPKKGRWMK